MGCGVAAVDVERLLRLGVAPAEVAGLPVRRTQWLVNIDREFGGTNA